MMLVTLLKGLAVSISLLGNTPAPVTPAARPEAGQVAGLPPEVRLRKLHLVRPDLIPFPIAYEVYC